MVLTWCGGWEWYWEACFFQWTESELCSVIAVVLQPGHWWGSWKGALRPIIHKTFSMHLQGCDESQTSCFALVIRRSRRCMEERDVEKKAKMKRERLYGVCVFECTWTHLVLGRLCSLFPSLCLYPHLVMLSSCSLWHLHEETWVWCPIVSLGRHGWSWSLPCV